MAERMEMPPRDTLLDMWKSFEERCLRNGVSDTGNYRVVFYSGAFALWEIIQANLHDPEALERLAGEVEAFVVAIEAASRDGQPARAAWDAGRG